VAGEGQEAESDDHAHQAAHHQLATAHAVNQQNACKGAWGVKEARSPGVSNGNRTGNNLCCRCGAQQVPLSSTKHSRVSTDVFAQSNNEPGCFTFLAKLSNAKQTACSSGAQTTGQSKTRDTRRLGVSPASHPPLCLLCSWPPLAARAGARSGAGRNRQTPQSLENST
jgi:hypothetical protein